MCGIFGWVVSAADRQSQNLLISLTDEMKHRGPDGSGYWLTETADSGFQIAFGHRRLSIIDMAGGSQPMRSADGAIVLIFNGEIYNYIELRDELKAGGHNFRTSSDTEVLIEAYRTWGLDAVRRFRGMFAFALWDNAAQHLLLARDAFGKKPLFLAERRGALVFGSEVEPLLQFPGIERTFDPDALGQYLLNRYVPGPATFFRTVRKLQPGCYGLWREGKLEITRYFTPPIATTKPDISTLGEATQMFEGAFDESVRIRMRSDAAFGAYLSGGIDSSAVVATMVRHSTAPVRTFAVGFQEAAYSELDHARAVAQRFATEHHELIVDPDGFMENWPVAVQRRGAPVTEASDIPMLMLSKMASSDVKMVLTGEGADELMGGYPKHRAESWVQLYQQLIPRLLHEAIVGPAIRALPYGLRRVKVLATAAGERDLSDRMRVWFGGVSVSERDAILGWSAPPAAANCYPFSATIGSAMRRTLFFDQTSWLPDNLLERGDRMMMAGSIEGRMPFMDTVLAATVARFPDKFLIGRKGGKVVLRTAMEKILPAEILGRRKVGFRVPFNEWFRGPYRDLVSDMLTSEASVVGRICNGAFIRHLTAEHTAGQQNHEKILWSLINLEMFLRSFKPTGLEAIMCRAQIAAVKGYES
jgi:asparagine synthase (glutamine-hydrolysing)